jgi:hypothetical protein
VQCKKRACNGDYSRAWHLAELMALVSSRIRASDKKKRKRERERERERYVYIYIYREIYIYIYIYIYIEREGEQHMGGREGIKEIYKHI